MIDIKYSIEECVYDNNLTTAPMEIREKHYELYDELVIDIIGDVGMEFRFRASDYIRG